MMQFAFPDKLEDLEVTPQEKSQFFVQECFQFQSVSEKEVIDILYDVSDALSSTATSITENQHFDVLFSLVNGFHESPGEIQGKIATALSNGVRGLLLLVEQALASKAEQPTSRACAEQVDLCRMAVKMYAFLICNILRVNEEGEVRRHNVTVKAGKKKKKTSTNNNNNVHNVEQMLLALLSLVESSNVFGLWPMNTPEQKLGDLCFVTASRMLENPEHIKSSSTRPVVFALFAAVIVRFQLQERASGNLLHVLTNFEAMSVQLPAFFLLLHQQYKDHTILSEFLAEIDRLDSKLLAKDNAGAKNIGAFITALGSDAPHLVLPHLSTILDHLNDEAYVIRNGVIQLAGHLMTTEGIAAVAEQGEVDMTAESPVTPQASHKAALAPRDVNREDDGDDAVDENEIIKDMHNQENQNVTKLNRTSWNSLFVLMSERVHDVTSFTRSKVLQMFIRLVESHQLSQAQLIDTAELACDRLQDKAAAVRKNAVQLLAACLEHNPIGPSLRLAPFQSKLRDMGTRMADVVAKKKLALGIAPEQLKKLEESEDGEEKTILSTQQPQAVSEEEARVLNENHDKLRKNLQYYHAVCKFITCVEEAVPQVCALLSSKTLSDVMCAIKFFGTARQFRVTNSGLGVRKMMLLVWSRDNTIREQVIKEFERLYLGGGGDEDDIEAEEGNEGPGSETHRTCMNLIRLTTGITLAELTSYEELLYRLMQNDKVPEIIVEQLWATFSSSNADVATQTRRGALTVLGFLSKASPTLVLDNLTHIVSIGLGPRSHTDPGLARAACTALQHIDVELPTPTVDAIMTQLRALLEQPTSNTHWYNAAQEAISTIFSMSKNPDAEMETVIRRMAGRVGLIDTVDEMDNDAEVKQSSGQASMVELAHLLFIVGHTSIKMLVYLEALERATKKRVAARPVPEAADGEQQSSIEQDLAVAAAEDYQIELLRDHAEQSLVASQRCTQAATGFSSPIGLLGMFGSLLKKILTSPKKYNVSQLQTAAVLALCKFMAVSSKFCEEHLQLLFTLLEKSGNTGIRVNILVAVGDMSVRFPNLIEPWTKHIYARLDDKNAVVRKNALMVLTHLILNDMVKAKGPVVAIAKCLRDPNAAIADLACLFFQELSRKGENPVYNVLPDVISRLSTDSAVDQDAFRYVLKFLLQYVSKDKQVESLVDKLCHRFHAVHVDTKQMQAVDEGEHKDQQQQPGNEDAAMAQCRNMAYCLSELNLTQGAFNKFMSLYSLYANKLGDGIVFEYMQIVLNKGKKVAKAEAKANVEEFEIKLQEGHDKQIDDIYADTHAKGARRVKVDSSDVLQEIARLKEDNEAKAKERQAAKAQKGRRGRKPAAPVKPTTASVPTQEEGKEEEENKTTSKKKTTAAPKRKAPLRRRQRKKVVESSSEEEETSSSSSSSSGDDDASDSESSQYED